MKCERCAVMDAMMPHVARKADALIRLLRADELPTARELSRRFGVNIRTGQRWLQEVREARMRRQAS